MRILVLSPRLTENRRAAFRALAQELGELRFVGPGEPALGRFSDAVHRAMRKRGYVRFMMERQGREFEAAVTPVPACAVNVYLDTMPLPAFPMVNPSGAADP